MRREGTEVRERNNKRRKKGVTGGTEVRERNNKRRKKGEIGRNRG